MRFAGWVLSAVLVLGGCASETDVPDTHRESVPTDATTSPTTSPSPTEVPALPPATITAPAACEVGNVVTYPKGARCGLDGAGQVACPGEPVFDGFVYACEDEEGSRQPNAAGCRDFAKYTVGGKSLTKTICRDVRCTPYADVRCGEKRGFACPDPSKPGVSTAPSPGDNCWSPGGWAIDLAHGDLLCCD